jgi:hypothetical protein
MYYLIGLLVIFWFIIVWLVVLLDRAEAKTIERLHRWPKVTLPPPNIATIHLKVHTSLREMDYNEAIERLNPECENNLIFWVKHGT